MYACNLYLIVCNNIFHTKGAIINEKYDLKGSSIYRNVKVPKIGQQVKCKMCGETYSYSKYRPSQPDCEGRYFHQQERILKDNDIKGQNQLCFPLEVANEIYMILEADADFLADTYQTMDYSLLGKLRTVLFAFFFCQ
jgi:hypothetical protein